MRLQIWLLTILVAVLGVADGVKLARYQQHRDDLGSQFASIFHRHQPGWFDWMRRE